MHLVARDSSGAVLATTDIVLPVSDEMDCRSCHASGSGPAAQPPARLGERPRPAARHAAQHPAPARRSQGDAGSKAHSRPRYDPPGSSTATVDGKPILCAGCHAVGGAAGPRAHRAYRRSRKSIHGLHAGVVDPTTNLTLDSSSNRTACYRCHPGSTTRCLRGAMGAAVAADGTLEMQCQSCHGSMSTVAATHADRVAERTGLPELPHRHRHQQQRPDPLHLGVRCTRTRARRRSTRPSPPIRIPRRRASRSTASRRAMAGSSARPAMARRTRSFPARIATTTSRASSTKGTWACWWNASAATGRSPSTVNGGPHGMHPVGQTG